jgi:AAA15 family ATPase/GTPase
MLIEFRVRNYSCFRDEQVLSMVASSDTLHPDNIIDPILSGNPRLLRSVAIYGANGSGKTKLLEAFNFLDGFVSSSFLSKPQARIHTHSFIFDEDSKKLPSDFEVLFIKDNIKYQFGFSVDTKRVFHEWLYGWPNGRQSKFYERIWENEIKGYKYLWGDTLKGEKESIRKRTRENSLFLTAAAINDHPQLKTVYEWFSPGLRGWKSNEVPLPIVAEILKKEKYKNQLIKMLQAADLSIEDYSIKEEDLHITKNMPSEIKAIISSIPEDRRKRFKVTMYHKLSNDQLVGLDLDAESEGTKRFFGICAAIIQALEDGGVIYVDELDASLHPLLSRAIIQTFHNPQVNCRNVQLIFNTHDTTLLDPDLFRRDQIWFIEKKQDYSSIVYSLAEFSPRREEALAKNYLQGRYGAIPFIGDLESEWDKGEC